MGTTEQFARFVVETTSEDIPAEATEAAAVSLMDAVGTALAGSSQEVGRIITEYTASLGGTPECRVIGTAIRTSPPNAAFANGALGHADDYDDVGPFGHPGVILTPTVLALGEQLHKSGRQVLEAYVLGYEVGSRIGNNIGEDHYERGWHKTSTVGTLAAAAAGSRLMGLDVTQTRMAFGIAASQASGVIANFGTMTKPTHPGNGARSGIVAATLASMGLTANPEVIEAPQGYIAVFGDHQTHLQAMTMNLGINPFLILHPGSVIKEWPCCYRTHAAIPLTTELVSQHEITPEQVERVEFISAAPVTAYLDRPEIDTGFGGKFSLYFTIAAAIVDGELTYDSFTDGRVNAPEIQGMMRRVTLTRDPARGGLPERLDYADKSEEIVIHLKDGRTLRNRASSITNTLRGHQVDIKFEANASRTLPRDQVQRALELFGNLEELSDVSQAMESVTLN